MQAGKLTLPEYLLLLPAPNTTDNRYANETEANRDILWIPDYVFLVTHHPTNKHYLVDLGVRDDAFNTSAPPFRDTVLKQDWVRADIVNPISILNSPGNATGVTPEDISAVILSHLHFDHTGNMGAGLPNAELWVGPTSCSSGRWGYPKNPQGLLWESDLPADGSRKIVEWTIAESDFEQTSDVRAGRVPAADKEGKYKAVERRVPSSGWQPFGPFQRTADVFGDGSLYLVDAPGHYAGHQLVLVRVKAAASGGEKDDYVILCGDAFHHPKILKEPGLMARPPYSFLGRGMHPEHEQSLDTVERCNKLAREENVWVVAAHDWTVRDKILGREEGNVEGVVCLDEWRKKG